ncbi:hypothetical protein [Brevibacterium album]|uniref:hypothetical protein n=1 Tax=Brevibacterium album TaxID=417948 RepID=UPI0003F78573|nr:hypothetical protein [Brevibacterium album]
MTNDAQAADLHEEIRRLRIRVTGLTAAALDAGARTAVRAALRELAELSAEARPVPDLGDRVLADQLVVLLSDCLPEYGAPEPATAEALRIAVRLRRALP